MDSMDSIARVTITRRSSREWSGSEKCRQWRRPGDPPLKQWGMSIATFTDVSPNIKLKIEIFIETPTQGPDAADGGVVGTHLEVWPVAVVAAVPRQHRAVGARHVHVVPWDVTHVSRVTSHVV